MLELLSEELFLSLDQCLSEGDLAGKDAWESQVLGLCYWNVIPFTMVESPSQLGTGSRKSNLESPEIPNQKNN